MEKATVQYDVAKYPNFKEYFWFKAHEEELLLRYFGRYLLIKDEKVVGDYDTRRLASIEAHKHFKPGTYIIHQCVKKEPLRFSPRLIPKLVKVC